MQPELTSEQQAYVNALNEQGTESPEAAARPERVTVRVPPESRLEGLLCLYEARRDAAAAADAAFSEVKDGILAELLFMYPEDEQPSKGFDVPGCAMYPALAYNHREQRYLGTTLIREHLPQVYDAFAVTRDFWELRKKK